MTPYEFEQWQEEMHEAAVDRANEIRNLACPDRKWKALAIIIFLIALMFSCAVGLSHAEDTPLYCQPRVISAMNAAWQETGDGTEPFEAAFALNGTADTYRVYREPHTEEKFHQSVYVFSDTFALFHVHTNGTGLFPSTPDDNYMGNGEGDTGVADKDHLDMYVMSEQGLTAYFWRTKKMAILRTRTDWLKKKDCI